MRWDAQARHNSKVARIQYNSGCFLWCSSVWVRSLKVRWQPLHRQHLHPGR
jgi:hypothetical protein